MDFVTAIKTCLSKYAMFQGRAGRAEYWWWVLFSVLVNLVLSFVPPLNGIVAIALLLPGLAVSVRRLHDLNRSGWFLLLPAPFGVLAGIFGALYFLGRAGFISPNVVSGTAFGIFGLLTIAAYLILLFWFCQKGTAGPNQYGAAPVVTVPNLSVQTTGGI
jgi:uncharacterized membrane protein YhaH (DUF805 family)